jgi:hypothetical protein
MIARRSLFRALVAAPLAAKAAVDKAVANAAGVAETGLTPGYLGCPASTGDAHQASTVLSWLKVFGLPEFERERIWNESQHVSHLDADIAAKRSWSMSVKIAHQRQRNFHQRLASAERHLVHQVKRDEMAKATGWSWWF